MMKIIEEEKSRKHERNYDKKREKKRINRQMFVMRNTMHYERLGVPIGTSRADVKAAYRKLALQWHPDKWAHKSDTEREEAERNFKEVQFAYNSLTSVDEEADTYNITFKEDQSVQKM